MKLKFIVRESVKKWINRGSVFFSVTPKSARDTILTLQGHLSINVTGKVKNFRVIFSKIVTSKFENSRAFRKIDVRGHFNVCHGHFCAFNSDFFYLQLSRHRSIRSIA